ncbi:hypothetical protein RJ639_010381 [Escallonia herrerae]|uniref:GAG-pre-integrase domain-containing protein n=1 Tax=Escallonia herrerae TaxID=1293975 RepID=A0AA88VQZ9_9ASTE|nr:hypothetical protein RJ639_010381 [Escallonia herrerae]
MKNHTKSSCTYHMNGGNGPDSYIRIPLTRREVGDAYSVQFTKDMEAFISSRAQELVPGGLIVILILGLPDGHAHTTLDMGYNLFGSCLEELANMSEKAIESAFQSKFNMNPTNDVKKFSNQERGRNNQTPFEEDLRGEEEEMEMKEEDSEKEGEEAKIILIEMFLDSGCSNHMAADKNVFLDMDNTFKSHGKLGNGALVKQKAKELLVFKLMKLLEHGCKLDFVGDGYIIYDNGKPRKVVKKIKMQSNISFPFTLKYMKSVALKVEIKDGSWLWHKRFRHLNFQELELLFQKGMV